TRSESSIWNQTQSRIPAVVQTASQRANPLDAAASGKPTATAAAPRAKAPRRSDRTAARDGRKSVPSLAARWKKWNSEVVLPRSDSRLKKVITEKASV